MEDESKPKKKTNSIKSQSYADSSLTIAVLSGDLTLNRKYYLIVMRHFREKI